MTTRYPERLGCPLPDDIPTDGPPPDPREFRTWVRSLPHRQQVICELTAIEIIFAVLRERGPVSSQERTFTHVTAEQLDHTAGAIVSIRRWLDDDSTAIERINHGRYGMSPMVVVSGLVDGIVDRNALFGQRTTRAVYDRRETEILGTIHSWFEIFCHRDERLRPDRLLHAIAVRCREKLAFRDAESAVIPHGDHVPVALDDLRIAEPCRASWDRMSGDDRARHCQQCNQTVFNISAMTRDEANELLATSGTDFCARAFVRQDGTFITRDCPDGYEPSTMNMVGQPTAASLRWTDAMRRSLDDLLHDGDPPPFYG